MYYLHTCTICIHLLKAIELANRGVQCNCENMGSMIHTEYCT